MSVVSFIASKASLSYFSKNTSYPAFFVKLKLSKNESSFIFILVFGMVAEM